LVSFTERLKNKYGRQKRPKAPKKKDVGMGKLLTSKYLPGQSFPQKTGTDGKKIPGQNP